MKQAKRKNISTLFMIVLIMLLFLTSCADSNTSYNENTNSYNLTVQEATSDFYVNDFANLFSEEQKLNMLEKAVLMDEEYSGIQVVITTVESFDKVVLEEHNTATSIDQISYSMYNQYGIGQNDMGILILFSLGDREVKIETGKQMQIYITDSVSGQILDDYGMDYFVNDQFAEGLIAVQDAVINEIQNRVSKDWNADNISSSTEIASDNFTTEEIQKNMYTDNPTIVLDSKTDDNNSRKDFFVAFIVCAILLIVTIIVFILKMIFSKNTLKTQEEEFNITLNGYKNKLSVHENDIIRLKSKLSAASQEITELKDFVSRIKKFYPNIEQEIQEMIESEYQASALELDNTLNPVLKHSADKDNIYIFESALEMYNNTTPEVRKYVTTDIEMLRQLLYTSMQLKSEYDKKQQKQLDTEIASQAFTEIRAICRAISVGNYKTYNDLNKAHQIFEKLTSSQKELLPNDMIQELLDKFKSAKTDFNNYEAANKAELKIRKTVNSIYSADEGDLGRLRDALNCYSNLTDAQKKYFSTELFTRLNKLLKDAEADYNNRDSQTFSNYTTHNNSTSYRPHHSSSTPSRSTPTSRPNHSGHGGSSSGGGAKRKF